MNAHVRSKERRARLEQIERELALVKKKTQSLKRNWDDESAEALPPERGAAGRTGMAGPADDESRAPAGGGEFPAGSEGAVPADQRERFASYFMSGNLGRSGAQLRKERRAQRNRAILMAVFALIFLGVLVNFLIKSRVDF